jgi:hypothetical protein
MLLHRGWVDNSLTTKLFRRVAVEVSEELSGIESTQSRPEDGADPGLSPGVALKTDCSVNVKSAVMLSALCVARALSWDRILWEPITAARNRTDRATEACALPSGRRGDKWLI